MQRECRDVSDVRSVCRYTLTIEKHDVHANANREIREKLWCWGKPDVAVSTEGQTVGPDDRKHDASHRLLLAAEA